MSKDNNHKRIEDYLDGLMTESDRQELEAEFQKEGLLKEELDLSKEARDLVNIAGRKHLKSKFDSFEEELSSKQPRIQSARTRWISIAASLLVLITAGFWLLHQNNNTPEGLFANHFEPFRPPINIRSSEPNTQNIWEDARVAYAEKDYELAADRFKQVLEKNAQVEYLTQFYLGLSLLSKNTVETERAVIAFDRVLQSDNDYREQALWYKGLSFLKMGKIEEAKIIFIEIFDNQSFNHKKAKQILDHLA